MNVSPDPRHLAGKHRYTSVVDNQALLTKVLFGEITEANAIMIRTYVSQYLQSKGQLGVGMPSSIDLGEPFGTVNPPVLP